MTTKTKKATPPPEKTVESKKTFTFEIVHYTDGSSTMNRENNGFSVVEILGITELVQQELMDVYRKGVQKMLPSEINRKPTNSPMIHKPKSKTK